MVALVRWIVAVGAALLLGVSNLGADAASAQIAQSEVPGSSVARVESAAVGDAYDYRSDFARPPPVEAGSHDDDTAANFSGPAQDLGRVRRVSSGFEVARVAPRAIGPAGNPGALTSSQRAQYLFDNWHPATFPNRTQSINYHLARHGKVESRLVV